jgi:hypothetical protein
MNVPRHPRIYHIVHLDRLPSVIGDGFLWSDSRMQQRTDTGTAIGLNGIKERRLTNTLTCYSDLCVGSCVPFYFCPRSVMLYVIYRNNHPDLTYHGGQEPIVHLEADFYKTVKWADAHKLRWAFTLSNAGSFSFEAYNNSAQLDKIDWNAVNASDWEECRENKQAEFLLEERFPWELIVRIGVQSQFVKKKVRRRMRRKAQCIAQHKPPVCVLPEWYY